MSAPCILVIGTADTKSAEILFMRERIEAAGGSVRIMDVGVLGHVPFQPEISNTEVAAAAGVTIPQVANSGDENTAMMLMARGAARITAQLHAAGQIDGMLALGGTMGTDLALEVAAALPLGVPKVLVSTVAYSHLLPPHRIPPDLIMVLWAGGLYGLNSLCCSALAQAAGAVLGACQLATKPYSERPLVGMTSLGTSGLKYMTALKPALEARGYEVAVFHTTGMGGHAFEILAAQGRFAAVMDFSLQELSNHLDDSCVTAGPDRLLGAGRAGVPQIVATGATDMVDFQAWRPTPQRYMGLPLHEHNRLIASACTNAEQRRELAREIGARLAQATGPTCLLLPLHGVEEWDRPGNPLHAPEALGAFNDEIRASVSKNVQLVEINAHINDRTFSDTALAIFDQWVAAGHIVRPAEPHNKAA